MKLSLYEDEGYMKFRGGRGVVFLWLYLERVSGTRITQAVLLPQTAQTGYHASNTVLGSSQPPSRDTLDNLPLLIDHDPRT